MEVHRLEPSLGGGVLSLVLPSALCCELCVEDGEHGIRVPTAL